MIGETAAAAVTESRTDLPNVTSADFAAAQGALGVRPRGTVVDKNKAEHGGPPLGLLRKEAAFNPSPALTNGDRP